LNGYCNGCIYYFRPFTLLDIFVDLMSQLINFLIFSNHKEEITNRELRLTRDCTSTVIGDGQDALMQDHIREEL